MNITQVQVNQVQAGVKYGTIPVKCVSVLPNKIVICVILQGRKVQNLKSALSWQDFSWGCV